MTYTFILGFAAAAVVLQIIRMALSSWQHARKAHSLGCSAIPHFPSKDPMGISNLKQSLAADRKKLLPVLSERRVEIVSEKEGRYVTTYVIRNMGRDLVFTIDPKNIQAVLATQFKDFELGTVRQNSVHPLLGTGIFTADGEEWSRSRGLLRPQFTRDQISQLDLEEAHVQKAMQALPVAANGWTAATDIQSIFFRLTIDSATEFLFGESVESQLGALQGTQRPEDSFAYYFDKSQWVCAQRARFEKLAFLVNSKETRHSDKQVHAFVDKFVHSALAATQSGKPRVDEEKSQYVFLDALVATTRDPVDLRSQLLNILLAGRDTTASLLSWTILMLARNPEVFRKLRETIIETFGTYSAPQNITFATLKSCQYLQYCMNESLRLFPVVPFNRRAATRDTTIPRGGGPDGQSPVYIKKGQSVVYSTHVMHRRKDIWGPDADKFKPDRWFNRKVGWEYVPFNGGPRICIGQQFALTEAGYVLVRLLQRFDQIQDVDPDREIRWGLTLTSCPADLVTVRMHQADDA
ncbi:Cytochrome P450 E-class CYP52 [Penicillium macrosclerotiorum]|uniref:Cytochrome P450 E-class CYP52 n=1 Tax=Penicillium macrosclerotiorum TaxID=303699 RepID=UPI0025481552|nr:Cytochrome P450 E-class CYP52 [Penicillium macrosclerotiorum]KAJ5673787.1 Cytochrome P450 E-class CYP52 [Penicillium macrosclerotiorum]